MKVVFIVGALIITTLSLYSVAHQGRLDNSGGHIHAENNTYHCHTDNCVNGVGPLTENTTAQGTSLDCRYPQQLEITVINIGQGDATLIASPTKLLLADSGESNWNSHADADKIAEVIRNQYGDHCRTIDYYVNSHLHLDHIGYIKATYNSEKQLLNQEGTLWHDGDSLLHPEFLGGIAYLVNEQNFEVKASYFRDFMAHNPNRHPADEGSKTYWNWRAYLQSLEGKQAMNPQTVVLGNTQIDMGNVGGVPVAIDVVQVDAATPSNPNGCDPATYFGSQNHQVRGNTFQLATTASENDLSVAFVVSLGDFNMFIGGDSSGENARSGRGYRYHDTETCMAKDDYIVNRYGGKLDVLRVNHHGSDHSSNQEFLDMFDPKVAVVSVGDRNRHNHVKHSVLERLIRTSTIRNNGAVYLTEAGIENNDWGALCVRNFFSEHCAIIGDDELHNGEPNELGDASVSIRVNPNGDGYWIFAANEASRRYFKSI